MSPHCILWYGMVLYFIWSDCTVSHCYVPLLQRAGELPRSASSHFHICICKVEESGSKAQWAEYLLYLDSMVEDGLLRFIIMLVKYIIN